MASEKEQNFEIERTLVAHGKESDTGLGETHSKPQSLSSHGPEDTDGHGDNGEHSHTSRKLALTTTDTIKRPPMALPREIAFILIICSTNILTQAGLGMTVVPLDVIGISFGELNPGQLSWFVAAYSLTVGTFILIAGRLGDMYVPHLLI